jgi:hypothetical protein
MPGFDGGARSPGAGSANSKGQHPTLAALQLAFPVGQDGWFAWVGADKYEWNPVTASWVNSTSQVLVRNDFTPTIGQTVFVMSQPANEPATVTLYINGVAYKPTVHFTTSGLNLTWLNTFALTPSDDVSILYT